MMFRRIDASTRSRLYAVHSWSGILFGLVLYVVCFSGVVALFHDELFQWERREVRQAEKNPISIDTILSRELSPEADHISLMPPRSGRPAWGLVMRSEKDHDREPERAEHELTEGRKIDAPYYGVARFFQVLHTNLHAGQFGGYFVGTTGLLLLLTIATGVVVHTRLRESFTTYRAERSVHVRWLDTHNVLGVWLLPFHVMIAFSGAVIGLAGLFILLVTLLLFKGDFEKAEHFLLPQHVEPAGVAAPMKPLAPLLADAEKRAPNGKLVFIDIHNWGDSNARIHVSRKLDGKLEPGREFVYDGVTGELRDSQSISDSYAGTFYLALLSLHYGNFGGVALKLAYAVLGLGMCGLILSGCYVWIERKRSRAPRTCAVLEPLIPAVALGMVAATGIALASHHLAPREDTVYWIGVAYFGAWLATGSLVYFTPAGSRSMIAGAVIGLSFLLPPIVHGWTTGDHFVRALGQGNLWVAAIDLTLVLIGLTAGAWLLSRATQKQVLDKPR